MGLGAVMASKASVAHHSFLFGLLEGLDDSTLGIGRSNIAVFDLVDHPEVDVVGFKTLELNLKHLESLLLIGTGEGNFVLLAVVNASLGHDEGLVAPASRESLPHPFLGAAVVILPGVVEEIDPLVDRVVRDVGRLLKSRGKGERMTAEADAA